jgi:hypothetical protein
MKTLDTRRVSLAMFIGVTMLSALLAGYVVATLGSSRSVPDPVAFTEPPAVATPTQALPTPTMQVRAATTMGTAVPSPTAVATPTRAGTVFLVETFDAPGGTWIERQTDTRSAVFVDGTYALTLTGAANTGVSSRLDFDAYRLGVDVWMERGGAGLVFIAAEPATFYRFLIRPDGTYAIQAQRQQEDIVTDLVAWTDSAAIRRGTDVLNRLQVERSDDVIRCFINNEPVIELTVPAGEFVGQYGLTLAALDAQGRARFDNLRVERLED